MITNDLIIFVFKLLDKGFTVAVAVICLLIMWKALPIFSQIKIIMLATNDYQKNNNEVIKKNTDTIDRNTEVLRDVKDKL